MTTPASGIDYDAELRLQNYALRRVADVQAGDRVLDIGCGTGLTTREAATMAVSGIAFGIDVSATAIERAQEIARAQGVGNVTFKCADAQTYEFPLESFDVVISRFGTMFFEDPDAAFVNIRRGVRRDGRLVMIVWQASEANEWNVGMRAVLDEFSIPDVASSAPDPFTFADPDFVTKVLGSAGFVDVSFHQVDEPIYFGPDVETALTWVRGFTCTSEVLNPLVPADLQLAIDQLRGFLHAHLQHDGVWMAAKAWIVTARAG